MTEFIFLSICNIDDNLDSFDFFSPIMPHIKNNNEQQFTIIRFQEMNMVHEIFCRQTINLNTS